MHQPTESSEEDHEPHNDCIGNLEHHVHKVFALVRVPGEDFVYSASIDLFNKLDDYCDEQGMVESRPPFLIKGESGTGKSALLSNWLQRRERSLMRSRTGNSDHFIFWHAVGCSRQSMNVNVVIKRLIVELKTRFELSRPLPKQQERYSWELPRFLDLAAKRGKVIIVIDGLNRLVNNDGSEDSLAWLPLVFPPNVRVILSVTIPTAVRMKQVGNAVKAMRVMSKFSMAKEANAAQAAVLASTSTTGQESAVLSEERPASPGVQNAMAALLAKKPFASAAARATSPNTQASVASVASVASSGATPNPFMKAASFSGNDGGEIKPAKKSRILAELDRRGIPFMQMTPLNKQLCRSLVESFIHKSVNSESASLATGPHIASYLNKQGPQKGPGLFGAAPKSAGNRSSTMMVGSHPASAQSSAHDGSNEEVPGFLLFENQISALLNHAQGGTPLFLRLFLRCLQYAVSRGYSLWMVYEDWMRARSVPELLIRILRTLENNFARTRSSAQTACDKTIAAGGLPALKQLYSWHPAFQQPAETKPTTAASAASVNLDAEHGKGVTFANTKSPAHMTPKQLRRMSTATTGPGNFQSLLAGEAGDQVALATIAAAANESMAGGAAQVDDGAKQLSSEVRQNLGDQAWFATEKDANMKLQKGIRNTEEATAAALGSIKLQAAEDSTDLLQALVKTIRQAHETAMAAAQFEEPGAKRVSHIYSLNQARARNPLGSFDSVSEGADDSFEDEDGFDSDDDQDSLVSLEERSVTSDHTVHSKTIKITQELIPPAMRISSSANTNLTSPSGTKTSGFNTATGESMATSDLAAAAQKSAKSPFKALASSLVAGQQTGASPAHPSTPSNTNAANVPFTPHGASTATATSSFNAGPAVDPSDGLHLLPLYLRGGADTTGFGDILGNALALLYASRQGLRESELWKMLSLLQYKSERDTALTQEMKALNHSIVRRTALLFLQEKGALCDMFKAEDITRTGYIARKQILLCLRKINPEIRREDLIKTLEFADLHTPTAPTNVNSVNLVHYYQDRDLLIGDKVHYQKLFVVLGKLNKLLKFAEVGQGKTGALLATAKPAALAAHPLKAPSKGAHGKTEAAEDDYENFKLTVVGAEAAGAQTSVAEGVSQEYSSTFLTGTVSDLDGSRATVPGQRGAPAGTGAAAPKVSIELGDPELEEEEEQNFSLGPVIEESLLCILSALGVLHDPENKVLILPSDSEPFRQVIYNNYILKRGGGTMSYWHSIIVRHFQTEPNSLRKCEELPWHLKICRKWHALRDALVDLDAFEIMAKTDLKSELMEYWVLLTEGPLPFPDPAADAQGDGAESGRPQSGAKGAKASGRKSKEEDGNESTYTHVLRDIDHAMETNISMKDARRRKYQSQVPPFDIVEELNKSMELWVLTAKPPAHRIHRLIILVARFLFEFSRSAHASPDFLRLGIDLESMNLFGGSLDPDMKGIDGGAKKPGTAIGEGIFDEENSQAGSSLSPLKIPGGTATGALSPTQVGGLKKGNESATKPAAADTATVLFGDTTRHEAPKFPTPQMLSSNLYLYLRWIWIQFPWIGLHVAQDVATTLKQIRDDEEKHRYDGAKGKPHVHGHVHVHGGLGAGGIGGGLTAALGSRPGTSPGLGVAPAAAGEHAAHEGEEPSLASFANNSDSAMLLRVWNVKKSDPTVPVFVKSLNRRLAAIKPRSTLTSGLERNVEVTFDKLYDEITSPSHIAKIRLGFKNKDKYRRPFEEEVNFNKNIPFAYHGVRSVRAGSLFPTYEKFLAEANQKAQKEMEEGGAGSKTHKKRRVKKFDVEVALQQQLHKDPKANAASTPFMLVELDDEIRRINNDEYINKHKVDRIGGAVIKDENDLEYEACMDRVARMKTIRNKLTVIYSEKVRTIHNLHRQVVHRHETDQQLIDEVVNSEVLLRHLNDRNVAMERDMEEAEKIRDGYNELLKVLKNNPPFIESHVKALEIEVQLAEKQFQDLCEHRNKLYHETEISDQAKRAQLIERIDYFQHARYEVAVKKKQILRQTRMMKGPNKRDMKNMNRRMTKSGKIVAASRMRGDSEDNTGSSGSDSENSANEKKDIQLTAPVMHFLNAIVRKTTFNEAVIKESDQTLEDIKKRFDEDELMGTRAVSAKHRRLNRMGSVDNLNADSGASPNGGNPASPTAAAASGAPAAQTDGDASVGGSLGSRNGNGGTGTGSVAGSLASRDSISRPRRISTMSAGGDLFDRRATGFGFGIGTPDLSGPFIPGLHGSQSNHPVSAQTGMARKKLAGDQLGQLREAVKAFLPIAASDASGSHHYSHTGKDSAKSMYQRAYDLLLEKTSSSSADELIERFQQGQTLLHSLRKQQTLVDSRSSQLQSEHAELFATFSDLAFIAEEGGAVDAAAATTTEAAAADTTSTAAAAATATGDAPPDSYASSSRYLDNQLFAHEVRMNKVQRTKDRAEQIVSDVRAAVGYLINLMTINAKLLYALPKSEPPPIKTNDDIMLGISWFEDRIMALSEALAMDANKPTGANTADDNKPLSERQLDLALLVQKMNLNIAKPGSRGNSRQSVKKRGGISSSLINADGDEAPFVSPANAVMVPPVGRIDKIFDNKMGKLIAEREKQADAQEAQQKYGKDEENNSTLVQNFLNEGLNLKETKDMARSANLLVNKRSGRVGSYGLVLENLLTSKGQHFHPTNSAIHGRAAKEASVAGPSASLASPSAMHSSVLNSSVSTGVVAGGKDGHTPTHAAAHAAAAHAGSSHNIGTASTDGRHHSRSSSPTP